MAARKMPIAWEETPESSWHQAVAAPRTPHRCQVYSHLENGSNGVAPMGRPRLQCGCLLKSLLIITSHRKVGPSRDLTPVFNSSKAPLGSSQGISTGTRARWFSRWTPYLGLTVYAVLTVPSSQSPVGLTLSVHQHLGPLYTNQ